MYASDFIFDGACASDYGLIIGTFDGDGSFSGGNIEYTVIKPPNRDEYDFYGSSINEVIKWNTSVILNPCNNSNNGYLTCEEERLIASWLIRRDGYKWWQPIQDGYEDIFYKVQINATPHQVGGRTVGFDLEIISNCGYGFSHEINSSVIFSKDNPIVLDIYNDIQGYTYPKITFDFNSELESITINNINDISQDESIITNISNPITMDSKNDIITGLSSPNCFNYNFIRLINGTNVIETDCESDINVNISYREARRVIV